MGSALRAGGGWVGVQDPHEVHQTGGGVRHGRAHRGRGVRQHPDGPDIQIEDLAVRLGVTPSNYRGKGGRRLNRPTQKKTTENTFLTFRKPEIKIRQWTQPFSTKIVKIVKEKLFGDRSAETKQETDPCADRLAGTEG